MSVVRQENASRLSFIDSIRGLAALAVITSHVWGSFGLPTWLRWSVDHYLPVNVLWDGTGAVYFFFVLSGFALAFRQFDDNSPRVSLRSFYLTRALRLYPSFLLVYAVSYALARWGFGSGASAAKVSSWLGKHWVALPQGWDLAKNLSLVVLDRPNDLLPHAWTLVYEVLYSLFVPFLIIIARQRAFFDLVAFTGVALCLGVDKFLVSFVAGILIAKHRAAIELTVFRLGATVRILLFALSFYAYSFRFLSPTVAFYIKTLGVIGLLCVTLGSRELRAALDRPSLIEVGRLSYVLYLVHFPVLMCFTSAFMKFWKPALNHSYSDFLLFSAVAGTAAISLLISIPIHYAWELPFISLSHRLRKSLVRAPLPMHSVPPPPTFDLTQVKAKPTSRSAPKEKKPEYEPPMTGSLNPLDEKSFAEKEPPKKKVS